MKLTLPNKSSVRQFLSLTLMVLGAVLMFFAPETWSGVLFLALGVVIEMIAMAINHGNPS